MFARPPADAVHDAVDHARVHAFPEHEREPLHDGSTTVAS